MSRQMRSREESVSYDTLQMVLNRVHELMKVYPNLKTYEDFEFQSQDDYGSHYPALCYNTLETDKEYNDRMGWEKQSEEAERKRYLQLKKKFEGNT